MSDYTKALNKIKKKARRYKPYGLRWSLFPSMKTSSRAEMDDEDFEDKLITKFIGAVVLWCLLGGLFYSIMNTLHADLFEMRLSAMTSAQHWQIFFYGFGPIFIYPPLILACLNHGYQRSKKKSKLSSREIDTLNQILKARPELIELVGPWMKTTTLRYGDLEKVIDFNDDLRWAICKDEARQERQRLDEESTQQLKAGLLGVFLEKQALNSALPGASSPPQVKRL